MRRKECRSQHSPAGKIIEVQQRQIISMISLMVIMMSAPQHHLTVALVLVFVASGDIVLGIDDRFRTLR